MSRPNPDLWSARIAEVVTRIRASVQSIGDVLQPFEFITQLDREGDRPMNYDLGRSEGDPLRYAEIEYLVFLAFNELWSRGELIPTEARQGLVYWTQLMGALGWSLPSSHEPAIAAAYRPTPRLIAMQRAEWDESPTMWPNVNELLRQALAAYETGLDVAAAVTARVAVEDATERSLEQVDPGGAWEPLGPALREARLFDEHLTRPSDFRPMDRAATRAALSGIRDRGNAAAHGGNVEHALLQESLMGLAPQALRSLSTAVRRPSGLAISESDRSHFGG